MKTAECAFSHAPEMLAIFNEAILNSTALYDYKPRTMDDMAAWLAAKETGGHPVIGAFEDDGTLAGFASFGTFRAWPAYKYSIEHSIYIRADKRGAGLGKLLLSSLIRLAEEKGYHMMIGGIDSSNEASVRLHRSLGFTHCASIRQAGYKFGRWLDLEFYQLLLPGPDEPDED